MRIVLDIVTRPSFREFAGLSSPALHRRRFPSRGPKKPSKVSLMTAGSEKALIFICEKDSQSAADLRLRLEALGYTVCRQTIRDEQAIGPADREKPDLLIASVTLQGETDGISAAGTIRDKWNIPVVFLATDAEFDDLIRANPAFPFGYLLKPFTDRDIKIAVETALHSARVEVARTMAEEALRAGESALREAQAIARLGSWELDLESGKLTWSDELFRIFGRRPNPRGEVSFDEISEQIHPDDFMINDDFRKAMHRSRPDKEFIEFEERITKPDGTERWLHVKARKREGGQGKPDKLIGITQDITERKHSEEALRETEERLRLSLDSAEAGVWIWDLKADRLFWDDRMQAIFGYQPGEFDGTLEGWKRRVHPDDLAVEEAGTRATVQSGSRYESEYRVLGPGNEWRWVSASAIVTRDADRLPVRLSGMAKDITDRKRSEEELQARKTFLDRVIDQSPIPTYISDRNGILMRANPALKKILNLTDEQLVGKYDIFKDTIVEQHGLLPLVRSVYEEGKSINFTLDWDGETIPTMDLKGSNSVSIEAGMFPIHNAEGELTNVVLNWIDVTDRKRAEEALRDSEERYRRIFSHMTVGLAQVSLDLRILNANKAFGRMFGYEEDAILDTHLVALIHPDVMEENRIQQDRLIKGEIDHYHLENTFIHNNGKIVIGLMDVNLIRNARGDPAYFLVSVINTTESKRLETQLRQAKKMEAVGTLAGGIAHDFNNLLQAIGGYSQLILIDLEKNSPWHENLNAILAASQRAKDLIRQLLLFSRKVDAERRQVDLNLQMEQAARVLARTIPKMVEIRLQPGSFLKKISADPVQMEQILLNLGKNAADAMPDGGTLTIETRNMTLDGDFARVHLDARPGDYVYLGVSDTGHGMDEDTVEHIFEPFYTTKEIGQGTGLGLATVYGIVQNHGGHITCHSRTGKGSIFKIYLPALEQDDELQEKKLETERFPQGGSETILLVDDEDQIRDVALKTLKKFGYDVLTASNGEEALKVYSAAYRDIDLVVLDIGMPGMGGHRCFQELIQINPEANIIIASGYAPTGQLKKTLMTASAGYLGKPYQLTDFLDKIRTVLDGNQ